MHRIIAIQVADHVQQLLFADIGGQSDDLRMQARLFAGGRFVAHGYLRSRVFADQHHGQAGYDAARLQRLHPLADFSFDSVGKQLAIDDASAHATASLVSAIFIKSATVVTSSFSMMLARCASTVLMLMFRSPAICRSEEHTSELQSLMRISYAVFCLKKKIDKTNT